MRGEREESQYLDSYDQSQSQSHVCEKFMRVHVCECSCLCVCLCACVRVCECSRMRVCDCRGVCLCVFLCVCLRPSIPLSRGTPPSEGRRRFESARPGRGNRRRGWRACRGGRWPRLARQSRAGAGGRAQSTGPPPDPRRSSLAWGSRSAGVPFRPPRSPSIPSSTPHRGTGASRAWRGLTASCQAKGLGLLLAASLCSPLHSTCCCRGPRVTSF